MNHDPRETAPLFDLPLAPVGAPPPPTEIDPRGKAAQQRARRVASESLPLFTDDAAQDDPIAMSVPEIEEAPAPRRRPRPVPVPAPEHRLDVSEAPVAELAGDAPLAARILAGGGDLVVLTAAGVVAALGARALGAPLGAAALAPLALFVLAFSYLYAVISLAFWGQTPGMAWAGLSARTGDSAPLSFGQTSLRWIGMWLTWLLGGLPGLLALTGRSLADRLSGSRTLANATPH